jgi:hypothetical protein
MMRRLPFGPPLDHLLPPRDAHRANPFDKNSRSATNCPIFACSFAISISPATLAASLAPERVAAMPSIAGRFNCLRHRR